MLIICSPTPINKWHRMIKFKRHMLFIIICVGGPYPPPRVSFVFSPAVPLSVWGPTRLHPEHHLGHHLLAALPHHTVLTAVSSPSPHPVASTTAATPLQSTRLCPRPRPLPTAWRQCPQRRQLSRPGGLVHRGDPPHHPVTTSTAETTLLSLWPRQQQQPLPLIPRPQPQRQHLFCPRGLVHGHNPY